MPVKNYFKIEIAIVRGKTELSFGEMRTEVAFVLLTQKTLV